MDNDAMLTPSKRICKTLNEKRSSEFPVKFHVIDIHVLISCAYGTGLKFFGFFVEGRIGIRKLRGS